MKIGKIARLVKKHRMARVIRVGGRQWISVAGIALYALDGMPEIKSGEELLAMLDVPSAEAETYSVEIDGARGSEEAVLEEDMSRDGPATVGGILIGWSGGVYVPLIDDVTQEVTWFSDKLTDPAEGGENVTLRVAAIDGARWVRVWRGLSLVAVVAAWQPTEDAVEAVRECMSRGWGI